MRGNIGIIRCNDDIFIVIMDSYNEVYVFISDDNELGLYLAVC